MKSGKLFVPPYGDEIRIIYTKNFNKAKEYYLKNKPKDFNEDTSVLENSFENGGACFYTCEDLHFVFFTNKSVLQMVHEAVHLANKILYRRGLKLTPDTEEAYTYLVQFLVREFTSFCRIKLL